MRPFVAHMILVLPLLATACAMDGPGKELEPAPCDVGTAQFDVRVTVPPADPPPNQESGSDARAASCTLVSVSSVGSMTSMSLTCDEDGGASGQPYELEFTAPANESFAPSEGATVELVYSQWWGFEVGGGTRIQLSIDGEIVLLAYVESVSQEPLCSTPEDLYRVQVDSWLALIGGSLVDAGCDEPALRADFASGQLSVLPGHVDDVPGADLRFVLQRAECGPLEDVSYGSWDARFAAWAPG